MTYISKITSAGQITIPAEIRKKLSLEKEDFLEFDEVGNAIVVRKLKLQLDVLNRVREKIKKSGVTKKKALDAVEAASRETWRENYA
ncbi:MAG: AbrB/MazE/SpoVT family DNA-binding domain-containing protein [Candidatus Altiarchaeota archaeon]